MAHRWNSNKNKWSIHGIDEYLTTLYCGRIHHWVVNFHESENRFGISLWDDEWTDGHYLTNTPTSMTKAKELVEEIAELLGHQPYDEDKE
jgi:hypothetical protein